MSRFESQSGLKFLEISFEDTDTHSMIVDTKVIKFYFEFYSY